MQTAFGQVVNMQRLELQLTRFPGSYRNTWSVANNLIPVTKLFLLVVWKFQKIGNDTTGQSAKHICLNFIETEMFKYILFWPSKA